MSFDQKTLYELLPAIDRIRDAEQGEPLKALLRVIAEQAAVLEENLAQLYDDQFVETAASWVLPYVGDLIGLTGLPSTDVPALSPRAETAHTIGYRRRKGTAAMLEQLAHDVTGWPARAVEFFELIAATQYLNHLRRANESFIRVGNADRLEDLGGAFERAARFGDPDLTHNVDVRRIAKGHGRYNVPNVGLFLWRLQAMSLTRSPAVPAAPGDRRRFLFHPLGIDAPLFNEPRTETTVSHLAEPINVPDRIRRRVLHRNLAEYYGRGKSLVLEIADGDDPPPIPSDQIVVCDLTGWTNLPSTNVAIDPVLGRIAFPQDQGDPVLATFHYGFSDDMGGGEYTRLRSADTADRTIVRVGTSIVTALSQLPFDASKPGPTNGGVVEIPNSNRYVETIAIDATDRFIEVRAGDKRRPTVELTADLTITGGENDEVVLDGLLLTGGAVVVSGTLGRLRLRHCTLVPGISRTAENTPARPLEASLVVESVGTRVDIERCIVGRIRTGESVEVRIADSIVDATDETRPAYGGNTSTGGPLRITNSTVIGQVSTTILRLASNSIFIAAASGPVPPIFAERRQEGCVRFSFLPPGARVPTRYRCQPEREGSLLRPEFVSTRFGDPGYGQLSASCPPEIRQGADDESSMGAFHDLFEPQREARLRVRLEEYLRFGLEAGLFYAS